MLYPPTEKDAACVWGIGSAVSSTYNINAINTNALQWPGLVVCGLSPGMVVICVCVLYEMQLCVVKGIVLGCGEKVWVTFCKSGFMRGGGGGRICKFCDIKYVARA